MARLKVQSSQGGYSANYALEIALVSRGRARHSVRAVFVGSLHDSRIAQRDIEPNLKRAAGRLAGRPILDGTAGWKRGGTLRFMESIHDSRMTRWGHGPVAVMPQS